MTLTAGYDLGGAHLKVAVVDEGRVIAVRQIACPLWRGIDQLDAALVEARALTAGAATHAVTMTGELADIFPDRYTGVARLIEVSQAALGPGTRYWMGVRGLGSADEALDHYGDVASANFVATATLCARSAGSGLLIDMGSTTTDIAAFANGTVAARGLTDADRLRTGELVYTGLTRTPVMAVTTRALFQGAWQSLARDPFATMADVYRILGTLPEGVDLHRTADGRGTSIEESCARLARCFGRDLHLGDHGAWIDAARWIAEVQLRSIDEGCRQVLSAAPEGCRARIITAGIGSSVVGTLAARLRIPEVSFGAHVGAEPRLQDWTTRCAPAVAVAILAAATHSTA